MSRPLRPTVSMPNIYLYREPVDFRKRYRGLAAIVEQALRAMESEAKARSPR